MTKLREIQCEMGCLKRADGSCSMACGDTVVLASCFGPGDCKASKQLMDRALLEISVRPKVITPGASQHSALESLIENVCLNTVLVQLFPRHVIGITIQEMQNNGAFQAAAAVNAACAALLDAGIPMRSTFAAVSISVDENGELELDSGSTNNVTLVFESSKLDLVGSLTNGCVIDVNDLMRCISFGQKVVGEIFHFYRSAIERKLSLNEL